MKRALLFVLVAMTADAGRFDRVNSRTPQGRTTRGLPGSSGAFLEFAPASGAGMGTACACAAVTGSKGEAMSFVRSTVAECYSNDGQTLTQCGVNLPLISSGTSASSQLGIWAEPDRTNLALRSRDLSVAPWARVSMTCTKTATGMRNDVNGASTCTATAGNGTVLQPITVAAATRNTSFHLKRRTGTGVVEVTRDNGATWTAVTASLSAVSWRRVASEEVPGCAGGNCIAVPAMTSGIANPAIGIRIVTSGDAVDVDFVQDEEGETATTPIETAGASGNRTYSIIDLPAAMLPTVAGGGFCMSAIGVTAGPLTAGGTVVPMLLGDGVLGATSAPAVYVWPYAGVAAGRVSIDTSGVVSAGTATWDPFYSPFSELSTQMGMQHTGALIRSCQRDVCDVGSASTLGTPAFTRLLLGRRNTTVSSHFTGVIKDVKLGLTAVACNAPRTGPAVWVGDSIVYGNASLPLDPPSQLTGLQPTRPVINAGVSSTGVASCGARYLANYTNVQTLIWSCAVNDLAAGTAGATLATAAQVFLADARSRGIKVIITEVTPWKNSTGWTAGKQTETDAYDTAMQTWAGANGAFWVATQPTMGGGGGDPDILAVAYEAAVPDKIHINAAGALQLATLVFAQTP